MAYKNNKVSLLDYLWEHYGGKLVANEILAENADLTILTLKAVVELINSATTTGIVELKLRTSSTNSDYLELVGYAFDGAEKTIVAIPKSLYITDIKIRKATLQDTGYTYGEPLFSVTTNTGGEYVVAVSSINVLKEVVSSDTIIHNLTDGVLTSELNIDTETQSVVKLSSSTKGVLAQLTTLNDGVNFEHTAEGLTAYIPILNTNKRLKIYECSAEEYKNMTSVDSGTVYFISDSDYFFYCNKRYGNLLEYNEDNKTITLDGETITLEDSSLYWVNT